MQWDWLIAELYSDSVQINKQGSSIDGYWAITGLHKLLLSRYCSLSCSVCRWWSCRTRLGAARLGVSALLVLLFFSGIGDLLLASSKNRQDTVFCLVRNFAIRLNVLVLGHRCKFFHYLFRFRGWYWIYYLGQPNVDETERMRMGSAAPNWDKEARTEGRLQ